jgi:hypothetical protein
MYKVLDRVKMNYSTGSSWRNLFGTITHVYDLECQYQVMVERPNGSKMSGYFDEGSFTLVENLPANEIVSSAESQERAAAYERRIQGREEEDTVSTQRASDEYWGIRDVASTVPVRVPAPNRVDYVVRDEMVDSGSVQQR